MDSNVPKAQASGPLWAWADSSGDVQVGSLSSIEGNVTRFPVRVIPGHGKVVPVELVEAIEKAAADLQVDGYDNDCYIVGQFALDAAIRAALEGSI